MTTILADAERNWQPVYPDVNNINEGLVGRPKFEIRRDQLQYLVDYDLKISGGVSHTGSEIINVHKTKEQRVSKYLVEALTLSCPKFIAASVYAHVRSRIMSLQSRIT